MNRTILYSLICTAAFLLVTAALRHAETLGYLSGETVNSAVQVMIGLGLAVWSNFTPKQLGTAGLPQIEAWRQRLLRLTGWAIMLAGLAYAGLWAFAPFDVAHVASIAVVASALVLTLGYAARVIIACRNISAAH